MKKLLIASSLTLVLAVAAYRAVRSTNGAWAGVDETVVGRYARAAGRPPREPFIDTDRGDLLLFVFLGAGVAGGFVGGYYFRELFPPQKEKTRS